IWSLGVILFMLVCGEAPFQEASDSETLTMIMDCKYKFPPHVSQSCRELISLMLKREPGHRANLHQIETHAWLRMGSDEVPHYHMPLISREQVSEEDHISVVEKMVEGCIASKEEILQSLEKDMYNHITATYYLLAERRLRKHRQENAAAMMQLRKHSAPPGKPHLEPLALSPRKQREIKKTKTAPLSQSIMSQMLTLPESPSSEFPGVEQRMEYFKSLTDSQTLERRPKNKPVTPATPPALSPVCPRPVHPLNKLSRSVPDIQEPTLRTKPKKSRGFSKIAILSSYFEQKIAELTGSGSLQKKGSPWRLFGLKKRSVKPRGLGDLANLDTPANSSFDECPQSKDAESTDDRRQQFPKQKGLVMSLLSPKGIHPTPTTSNVRDSSPASPTPRKCSLIQEESVDSGEEEDEDEDNDLELRNYTDTIREAKSAERLDIEENHSQNASPVKERDEQLSFVKRPLLSVASSPQLLNQICEENESEEEDDFVPPKMNPQSRMLTKRNSVASPEVIRKYEQRRKHRASGSRGTSCSSSDASDTDDTDGRSRKDKLKQKFIHRRDSSDHSSDTDGGPSGNNGGGGSGLGKGFNGGTGGNSDGNNDKGGGGRKKDGKGGSPKSGRSHHRGKQNNLNFKIGEEIIKPSKKLGLKSPSGLKHVIEKDETVSDSDAEDNGDAENEQENIDLKKLRESLIEKLNQENKTRNKSADRESPRKKSFEDLDKLIIANCSTKGCQQGKDYKNGSNPLVVKIDINRNMSCKQSYQAEPIKIEKKCCSLV
ncbi:hypothetical protein DPMN_174803, partial [Dreissena polymorpha]